MTPTARAVRLALDSTPFSYRAGQAALLAVDPDGEFTPYSFASSPAETASLDLVEFLVKVDGSTRFGARVSTLRRGDRVRMSGPLGSFVFPDRPALQKFLFVAGGTGIAPLRSMIRHALDTRVRGTIHLLYSARSPREFAYLAELRALARQSSIDLRLTLTGEVARWSHGRGRINSTHLTPLVETPETLAFICGPPAMLSGVTAALTALGIPEEQIRTESW